MRLLDLLMSSSLREMSEGFHCVDSETASAGRRLCVCVSEGQKLTSHQQRESSAH